MVIAERGRATCCARATAPRGRLATAGWLVVGAWALARPAAVPALRPASVGATGVALPRSRLCDPGRAAGGDGAAAGARRATRAWSRPSRCCCPRTSLHVAAMAAWLGGIAVLVLALRTATRRLDPDDRTALLAAVVARFSALAGIAFARAASSRASSRRSSRSARFGALLDTAFGRAVLIKLVLFGGLVALGWRQPPAAAAAAARRRRGRGRGCCGARCAPSSRSASPCSPSPARSPATRRQRPSPPARSRARPTPARPTSRRPSIRRTPGPNALHVYLFDRRSGAQFTRAKEVRVTAALARQGHRRAARARAHRRPRPLPRLRVAARQGRLAADRDGPHVGLRRARRPPHRSHPMITGDPMTAPHPRARPHRRAARRPRRRAGPRHAAAQHGRRPAASPGSTCASPTSATTPSTTKIQLQLPGRLRLRLLRARSRAGPSRSARRSWPSRSRPTTARSPRASRRSPGPPRQRHPAGRVPGLRAVRPGARQGRRHADLQGAADVLQRRGRPLDRPRGLRQPRADGRRHRGGGRPPLGRAATPAPAKAADGGSGDGLAITALIVGALGLVTGAAALMAARRVPSRA